MAALYHPPAEPHDLEPALQPLLSRAEAEQRATISVWLIDRAGTALTCRARSSRFVPPAAPDADRDLPIDYLQRFRDLRPLLETAAEPGGSPLAVLETGIWLRGELAGFVRFQRPAAAPWQGPEHNRAVEVADGLAAALERMEWLPPPGEFTRWTRALSLEEDLLQPIAGPNPAGENLRYTPIADRIKEARREEPDLPLGDWSSTRKTADWSQVIQLTREALATRSKDLQLAAWLTEALLRRDGFAGLRRGLDLLRELLLRFWDHLYPPLEDGDAEARALVLEWLDLTLAVPVQLVPLNLAGHTYLQYTASLAVPSQREADADPSRRTQREEAIAEGKLTPEQFDNGFDATRAARYQELMADLEGSLDALAALERVGQEKLGGGAPSYRRLRLALREVRQVASQLLANKMHPEAAPATEYYRIIPGAKPPDRGEPSEAGVAAPAPAPAAGAPAAGNESDRHFATPSPPAEGKPVAGAPTPSSPAVAAPGPDPTSRPAETGPEAVQLGVSAPTAARPGDVFAVAFVAYVGAAQDEVRRQLQEINPLAQPRLGVKTCRWKHRTRVRVRLSGKHLTVDPIEEEFTWEGDRHLLSFAVEVADDAPTGTTVLKFEVLVAGFRVALIPVQLLIRRDAAPVQLAGTVGVPYRTAFASYAAEDRDEVLARVASLTAATGMDVFLDCLSLHPGEEWKPRLEEEILRRDVFYLFWCSHAGLSEWVEWEWRTALAAKGLSAILPHPLTTVAEAEPPPELRDLHFGDAYMLAREAFSRRRRWTLRSLVRELLGQKGHR